MLTWVDTHAHLQDEVFRGEVEGVLQRAKESGIEKIVIPACSEKDYPAVLEICASAPTLCYPAIGLHPGEIASDLAPQLKELQHHIDCNGALAIGEIGLDAFHYKETMAQQIPVFEKQLEWATYYKLPVLIHARNTIDIVLSILERREFRMVCGILHAFEGTREQLARALKNDNLMIGIGGIATFKNGLKEDVLCALDLSRTVLETDSPYLAPTPFRGKRNEPSYIPIIGTRLATVRTTPLDTIASITTRAAYQLFAFES